MYFISYEIGYSLEYIKFSNLYEIKYDNFYIKLLKYLK